MLELRSVSWQNFLSYGDYVTTLEIDTLGQCLIIGEVINDDNNVNLTLPTRDGSNPTKTRQIIRRSNGAGKSTIPSVIQWVLFGRTMHAVSPGNNVINWFTGKDCWGKITFKNGDTITRTRNTDGKNELLITKDGDDTKFISDTLSTAQNQQQQLNRIFGLDWDVFCGSTFFNQYGKPWMEMADVTRKKAIERVLHVDRFTFYAQAAKTKCDNLDKLVEKYRNSIEESKNTITRLEQELTRLDESSRNFLTNRDDRAKQFQRLAEEEIKKRDKIVVPDVEKLKEKWQLIEKIQERIAAMRRQYNSIGSEIAESSGHIQNLNNKIVLWKQRAGKLCTSCEQNIPQDHISTKITPISDELKEKETNLNSLRSQRATIEAAIKKAETLLEERRPETTLADIKTLLARVKQHDAEALRLQKNAEKILKETNPHGQSTADIQTRIADLRTKIETTEAELKRSELLNKHYHYTYKAYNDRTKIKSFIFKDHIPFINSRLKYYLELFDLDVQISLTDALGISSNMWGYQFESGGERKRTDVAFMFAMFDLHEQMYGRQCNVLVLDEVDGRLDDDGIDSLINIIKNDLAHRVETILIISHRQYMFDTFPNEMRVVRQDRFSHLEQL